MKLFIEESGVLKVIFGTGEVGVSAGFVDDPNKNIGILGFSPQEPCEVGSGPKVHPNGECFMPNKESEELQFYFTKTESIDVLIGKLKTIKKLME